MTEAELCVLAWIRRRRLQDTFTIRQLHRGLANRPWVRDVRDLKLVVDALETAGWVRFVPLPPARGRPSLVYRINMDKLGAPR